MSTDECWKLKKTQEPPLLEKWKQSDKFQRLFAASWGPRSSERREMLFFTLRAIASRQTSEKKQIGRSVLIPNRNMTWTTTTLQDPILWMGLST